MTQRQIQHIMQKINQTCQNGGEKYSQYSCKIVSWDDVQRGTVGGGLSCFGRNITDTYLVAKDGQFLFTVRPDNWNEKLGTVSADEIALVHGNQNKNGNLENITLREFLRHSKEYGEYLELKSNMADEILDRKCSIRFQTTFLPITKKSPKIQFSAKAFNYQTDDPENPRNLVILTNSQGIALQPDGVGPTRIFHQKVNRKGGIDRFWLEAEKTDYKVGSEQKDTAEERKKQENRGKSSSMIIGTKAMGEIGGGKGHFSGGGSPPPIPPPSGVQLYPIVLHPLIHPFTIPTSTKLKEFDTFNF